MREVKVSVTFMLLAVAFCVCLIVSNLMEIKTVSALGLTITAGVIVFPVSYILNDCIVEVYGFAKARLVIWLGFGMTLLVSLLLQLGIWLPGAESWHGQEAMEMIFGAVPRIFLASFTAFLCGSMVNAYVMSRMKHSRSRSSASEPEASAPSATSGFSARAIVSSLWGEGVDSLIFFPIAFGGVLAWREVGVLIVTQTLLKTLYEILILPVTLRAVGFLRRLEGESQAPEEPRSYKWWRISEL